MSEEREQGTPQQELGGEGEPTKDRDEELSEDTGYDTPAGKERQSEEEFEGES